MADDAPTQHPEASVDGIVGRRLEYIYNNGWHYEMYVKNATTIDYRIHSGMVAGRLVKDQKVDLVALTEGIYKISWHEPTGTSVCVTLVPAERFSHGVIFFPRWVEEHPERTAIFQNDHLDRMHAYRDQGPTYPIDVVSEFANITVIENVGPDHENVIARGSDTSAKR